MQNAACRDKGVNVIKYMATHGYMHPTPKS